MLHAPKPDFWCCRDAQKDSRPSVFGVLQQDGATGEPRPLRFISERNHARIIGRSPPDQLRRISTGRMCFGSAQHGVPAWPTRGIRDELWAYAGPVLSVGNRKMQPGNTICFMAIASLCIRHWLNSICTFRPALLAKTSPACCCYPRRGLKPCRNRIRRLTDVWRRIQQKGLKFCIMHAISI